MTLRSGPSRHPSQPPAYERVSAILLLSTLSGLFLLHAVYLQCVAEDAFISFRYAIHLAQGHGLVWNVGEPPIEGYSNFLWVLIGALVAVLRLDLPLTSQVLGAVAGIGTILLTYRFARELIRLGHYEALVPVLLLAASGPFATWSTSGMETQLFTFLVVAGVYLLLRGCRPVRVLPLGFAAMAFFLAALTRPEGLMVAGVGAAIAWWLWRPALGRRRLALLALVFLLPCIVYFLWRLHYFGLVLPYTFYAKTGGGAFQYRRGAIYACFFVLHFVLPCLPLTLLAWWERSRRPAPASDSGRVPLRVCAAILAVFSIYIVLIGGDYMAMYRFFVPLLPFLYLLVGAAAASLHEAGAGTRAGKLTLAAALLVATAGSAVHSTPLGTSIFRTPPYQHGNHQGVQTERWHVARLSVIGQTFARHAKSPDDSLAVTGIGAIGYYSGLKIHDLYGLTDTYIARREPIAAGGWAGHEKGDLLYTLSKRPTYIVFTRGLRRRSLRMDDAINRLQKFITPGTEDTVTRLIRERYRLASVHLVDPGNGAAGYLTFLELRER